MKFNVPDMSCGHCVAAIEKAVAAADPQARMTIDLGHHTVEIASALPQENLIRTLADAGYPATPVS